MVLSVSTSSRVILIAGGTGQRLLQPTWTSVLPAEGIEPLVVPFAGECSRQEVTRLVTLAAGSGAVADDLNLPAILTPTIAEGSVAPGESSHNEPFPFPVTAEALISALRGADQLGRQRR